MKSHLNGKNKIKVAKTWDVSLIRYGAGTIKWNKKELQELDRKSRKIKTMNKELNTLEVMLPEYMYPGKREEMA